MLLEHLQKKGEEVGCIEGDCENGKGTYAWKDGSRYTGEFKESKFHGKGLFTSPDGKMYNGQYKEGKRHGKGMFSFLDGRRYTGEFHENKMSRKFHGLQ